MIKIKYQGKDYNRLSNAINEAILDGVIEHVEDILKPFKEEIKASGGEIIVSVNKDNSFDLQVKNVPDELADRIEKAI